MVFTKRQKGFKKGHFESFFERYPDWHTKERFIHILKKERNRSNRTGLPLSYILIDLQKKRPAKATISETDFYDFFDKLLMIITRNTRDFDIKHFSTTPHQIGILLVDTDLDGAKAFTEKISRILYQNFNAIQKKEYMEQIQSIAISSYPLDQMPDGDTVKATPLLREERTSVPETSVNGAGHKTPKQCYRENTCLQLNWRVVPSSNGSLYFTTPLFREVIFQSSDYLLYRASKRLLDIAVSLLNLIFFFPLMSVIALAVKFSSRGPILFCQERMGQFGKRFTFFKFRTMRHNSDNRIHQEYMEKLISGKDNSINNGSKEKPLYKIKNDPRITPLGAFLRKTSLDELPQLYNVLRGDMSLVGPRPPIPYEVEKYKNWHLRRILEAKPGVTGLWQVSARSQTNFDNMVRLDLKYAENQSLLLDLEILFKTAKAILINRDGAL